MKNILKKTAILLSSITAACSPATTNAPGTSDTNAAFTWANPLEYEYIDEDDSKLKKYTKLIGQNLNRNENASPVFRLGNLVFFEIKHSTRATDAPYRYRSAAVSLPNTYLEMPNPTLFKSFSEAIRSKSDALESYVWMKTLIMLSTGNPRYLQEAENAPTWLEKDGTLIMTYYRLRSNGMAAETKEKCVLKIDSEQAFSHHCEDILPE